MPDTFNGRLRDKLLNETLFRSLRHAREELESWRHDFNHERPHSSLGYLTPAQYSTILGDAGRGSALHGGLRAPASLQHDQTRDQITRELYLSLDEKWGSGHPKSQAWAF
jgi:putative transposase